MTGLEPARIGPWSWGSISMVPWLVGSVGYTEARRNLDGQITDGGLQILYALLLSLLITATRLVYTVVTVFDQSGSLKPLCRPLALQVCLSARPEMLVVMLLLGVGLQLLSIST